MSRLRAALVRQFARPSGLAGRLAGALMATRPSNRARNRWMLDLLALTPRDRVLEIGCGPGYALSLAIDRATDGFVLGIDHSGTMAAMARRRIARAERAGKAAVRVGDDRLLADHDAAFDVICSANVIQFLPDRPAFFARALRALAPGGRIATTFQPRGQAPSPAQADAIADACARQMAEAGFADIRVERLNRLAMPAVCILGRRPAR